MYRQRHDSIYLYITYITSIYYTSVTNGQNERIGQRRSFSVLLDEEKAEAKKVKKTSMHLGASDFEEEGKVDREYWSYINTTINPINI